MRRAWRDGPVVQAACLPFRRMEFHFQNLSGSSQPPMIPASGDGMPSPGPCRPALCAQTYTKLTINNDFFFFLRSEEVVHQLRTLAILPEDPGLVPNIHMVTHSHL